MFFTFPTEKEDCLLTGTIFLKERNLQRMICTRHGSRRGQRSRGHSPAIFERK